MSTATLPSFLFRPVRPSGLSVAHRRPSHKVAAVGRGRVSILTDCGLQITEQRYGKLRAAYVDYVKRYWHAELEAAHARMRQVRLPLWSRRQRTIDFFVSPVHV